MLNFDTITQKHSEGLIQQIVEMWERYNSVSHPRLMSLEERWENFISMTNNCQAGDCLSFEPTTIN